MIVLSDVSSYDAPLVEVCQSRTGYRSESRKRASYEIYSGRTKRGTDVTYGNAYTYKVAAG